MKVIAILTAIFATMAITASAKLDIDKRFKKCEPCTQHFETTCRTYSPHVRFVSTTGTLDFVTSELEG